MDMKELIVMRHAKSSWDFEQLSDHERPLNNRGIKDAQRIGARLCKMEMEPHLVLCSDAKRTQETWQMLTKHFSRRPHVCFLPSFYHASIGPFQEAIEFVHPQTKRILIIGHNPGWSELQGWLTGTYVEFKTATVAILTNTSNSWQEASQTPRSWTQKHILHPKEI
jgi:phosphohistidine phosphatase